MAVETSIFTRKGVERILRFAFEQARAATRQARLGDQVERPEILDGVLGRGHADSLPREYPDVEVTSYHIDAMAARMVMAPESLDVVVASNLFGDILTDLGAAIQGGLGLCRLRQHQSGPHRAIHVRTGARFGARHRPSRHRQPHRRHLVRRDDARASWRNGAPRR